jgi:hypothetical protein
MSESKNCITMIQNGNLNLKWFKNHAIQGGQASDCAQGQGARRIKSAAYTVVCEYFESACDAP